jgi:hypothetical protein
MVHAMTEDTLRHRCQPKMPHEVAGAGRQSARGVPLFYRRDLMNSKEASWIDLAPITQEVNQ